MRELVYLSDVKLGQFLPEVRALPRPQIKIKTDHVDADFTKTAGERKHARLEKIINDISNYAQWYTAAPLAPGRWVQFEAPLNHLRVERFGDLVLFVDHGAAAESSTRLILHGSARHLLIDNPPVFTAPRGEDVDLGNHRQRDAESGCSGASIFTKDSIELLLRILEAQPNASLDCQPNAPSAVARTHLPDATARLLHAVDDRLHPETATLLTGFARVTADIAPSTTRDGAVRCVVASPLYVEYAPPGDG
ncbi:hypothetical protein EV193_11782 [Herbihabitans rhizosphaerae]|uniref:Uncharacterized protein n=1 Tax=Herbihabitans rhizosphaerae TaxID=1872711 RepID=A0A4Q7KC47_9PSEU|nr:SAVMC3_10250 family protein [Herbihabitans rhizosphaerae]RZS30384.1 hypothetical protein EV193_11782 [Herbihabitans rhizosphaerae]